jgi:hypothetical protein
MIWPRLEPGLPPWEASDLQTGICEKYYIIQKETQELLEP